MENLNYPQGAHWFSQRREVRGIKRVEEDGSAQQMKKGDSSATSVNYSVGDPNYPMCFCERKVDAEYRVIQEKWSASYLFIEVKCEICIFEYIIL